MLEKTLKKLNITDKEAFAGGLATAATTGITIAKFLGKRSIYGAIIGIGVSLVAKKIIKKKEQKQSSVSNQNLEIEK